MCVLNMLVVTEFLVAEKESVAKISQAVISLYGVSAVDGNTDSRWALRIASSEKDHGELSDGRPSLWLVNNSSQGLFHSKRQTAYNQQLVIELTVSKGSVNNSIDVLGYSKACVHWVTTKRNRLSQNCKGRGVFRLAVRLRAYGESFLSRIVTGDGTWTKGQSVDWHHPPSPWKKFMATTSAAKIKDSWPLFSGRRSDFGRRSAT